MLKITVKGYLITQGHMSQQYTLSKEIALCVCVCVCVAGRGEGSKLLI